MRFNAGLVSILAGASALATVNAESFEEGTELTFKLTSYASTSGPTDAVTSTIDVYPGVVVPIPAEVAKPTNHVDDHARKRDDSNICGTPLPSHETGVFTKCDPVALHPEPYEPPPRVTGPPGQGAENLERGLL